MQQVLSQMFEHLPVLASFLGGILMFLSPCILPLIPSYMSYISGVGLSDTKHYSHKKTLTSAILFVIGFSIVFFFLGLAMINLFENIFSYHIVRYISGAIVILFGLHFLGLFKFKFLYKTKQLNLSKLENNKALHIIMPLIFGIGFAAGWTPCTGPIIAAITFLAAANQAVAIVSLVAFIIGLAIPFLVLALFLDKGLQVVRRLKTYMKVIEIVAAIFLIVVGILIILGKIEVLVALIEEGIGGF
ncbi:cytochrome c biogenesis protein CcdA [Helicobacter sp. 11S02629-2]|uniref:cytochrome c biogenesis protein CcdA n=1 Tax=Helicobacter sp. 11S02629-2 TaxID=1476195 RepID=UPI002150EF3E|nr:cytochrome c biogenesis protein CcdA [Helicobacter sp. 11S02629-2]